MNFITSILFLLFGLCCVATGNKDVALKREMPRRRDGGPIEVTSSMYILDITKVSEKTGEFRIQMYFRQRWTDERLKFNGETKYLNPDELKDIWKPDLFFVEESSGYLHMLTTPNIFTRIYSNGTVFYSSRMTMDIRCRMDLKFYPHDTQVCSFSIESYGYAANHIKLSWQSPSGFFPVSYDQDIDLPDFKIAGVTHDKESIAMAFGNYSRLIVEVTFERKIGFFMTKLFIPYILLIITSYFGFWIHAKFVLQRMALLLAILVIMLTLSTGLNMYIPESAYTKGTDVWISFCLALVFAAFIEFVYVSTLHEPQQEPDENVVILSGLESEKDAKKVEPTFISWRGKSTIYHSLKSSSQMDYMMRIIYPVLFGGFNVIYWSYYVS